ncbi:MAG TPA: hypothetical protein VE172_20090 [Stackebrandtia sp.]|uniref:hypothetical protein n=1 Tax=Stackebrandtia sp. TaxID=2023065 RepID=UPI002D6F8521|nr:hypothetical protein [Stackebrandtia sp.]HZE41106.1 hypothetical protein [Stackebrandtia sp.]
MNVRVTSPDGNITGTMIGPSGGTLAFREGSYPRYSERSLEKQLAALAKLLVVGRRRAQREAIQAATGFAGKAENPSDVDNPQRRKYLEKWHRLKVEGMSPSESVYMSATGMLDWSVVIKDGTLRKLDENSLLHQVRGAVIQLLEAQRDKEDELFQQIYEPDKN